MFHHGWDPAVYDHDKMNAIFINDTKVYKHKMMQMVWDNLKSTYLIEDKTLTSDAFKISNPKSLRYYFVNSSLESRFGTATLQEGNAILLENLGAGYIQITGSGLYGFFAEFMNDPKIDNDGDFAGIATNYKIPYRENLTVGPGYVSIKYPWEAGAFYWKVLTCPKYTISSAGEYIRAGNERETIDDMIKNGHDLRYVTNYCLGSSSKPSRDYPGDDFGGKCVLDVFVDQLFY